MQLLVYRKVHVHGDSVFSLSIAAPIMNVFGPPSIVIDPATLPPFPTGVVVCDGLDDKPVPLENRDMQLTRCVL